ncbi:pentapeptide repeat-containing protein [Aerosakkonema sp. BLCC-F183]|uniref:pentapeptide repeat-containing protein n=1 Tax=Aerosakkonema sp. BLCC-F183 TaxID=3342834 RepID=UPI0035B91F46
MVNNVPSIDELRESFTKVYDGPDRLQREYDLAREAERLNMPLDTYRRFYELRGEEPIDPYPKPKNWREIGSTWAKWLIHLPKKKKLALLRKGVFKLVQSGVVITVVCAFGSYIWEAPKRQKQVHYQAWQIINSAKERTSGGRIEALQDLNDDGVSLAGLNAKGVFLAKINLEGADLYKAELSEAYLDRANLAKANLIGASLTNASLSQANLIKANLFRAKLDRTDLSQAKLYQASLNEVNLSEADLEEANLTGALLKKANLSKTTLYGAIFRGADLDKANLQGAELCGTVFDTAGKSNRIVEREGCADFRGAKNLTPSQVKAAKDWQKADYDQEFRKQLNSQPEKPPASKNTKGKP